MQADRQGGAVVVRNVGTIALADGIVRTVFGEQHPVTCRLKLGLQQERHVPHVVILKTVVVFLVPDLRLGIDGGQAGTAVPRVNDDERTRRLRRPCEYA